MYACQVCSDAGVDADHAVEAALDAPVLVGGVDPGDPVAEGAVEEREDQQDGGSLKDAEPDRGGIHQNFSGFTRATTR